MLYENYEDVNVDPSELVEDMKRYWEAQLRWRSHIERLVASEGKWLDRFIELVEKRCEHVDYSIAYSIRECPLTLLRERKHNPQLVCYLVAQIVVPLLDEGVSPDEIGLGQKVGNIPDAP